MRCVGTKVCAQCGQELHVLAFAAHKGGSDGLHPSCRACRAESEATKGKRRPTPAVQYIEGGA